MCVWQSWVEIKHYSVAYFDHVTALQVLKCRTLDKGGARMCCVNVVSIHKFTHCVRAPPLMGVLCYSALNTVIQ